MCFKKITKMASYSNSVFFFTLLLVVHLSSATTIPSSQSIENLIEEETIKKIDFSEILDTDISNISVKTEPIITTSTPSREVSKTTMDIITIIWYLSTFLALAAFFFLMACSDRKCGRNRNNLNNNEQLNDDQLNCPPTPSPSYSEFAPPSYESIIKENHLNNKIYVVPIDLKLPEKKSNSTSSTLVTDCKIHTVNELQKNG